MQGNTDETFLRSNNSHKSRLITTSKLSTILPGFFSVNVVREGSFPSDICSDNSSCSCTFLTKTYQVMEEQISGYSFGFIYHKVLKFPCALRNGTTDTRLLVIEVSKKASPIEDLLLLFSHFISRTIHLCSCVLSIFACFPWYLYFLTLACFLTAARSHNLWVPRVPNAA